MYKRIIINLIKLICSLDNFIKIFLKYKFGLILRKPKIESYSYNQRPNPLYSNFIFCRVGVGYL